MDLDNGDPAEREATLHASIPVGIAQGQVSQGMTIIRKLWAWLTVFFRDDGTDSSRPGWYQ